MDYTTLHGEDVNEFIKNYRDTLDEQKEAYTKSATQARENAYSSIMGAANTKGMLYSNLPARTKIRYDTDTYYPQLEKINSTYQTGLDKLRANAVNTYNQIREYEKEIANLNSMYTGSNYGTTGGGSGSITDDMYIGNKDYRGWLAYMAEQGDTTAKALLNVAGNDGGVSDASQSSVNSQYWTYYNYYK